MGSIKHKKVDAPICSKVMVQQEIFKNLLNSIEESKDKSLTSEVKRKLYARISQLSKEKMNILITGATGCGKSSTINALFQTERAKVGTGPTPETMEITNYDLGNLVIWDSPGLGDGKEADERHKSNIIRLLKEKEVANPEKFKIDLVLVILDGSSRDLGTSYDLINDVIIPNLGTKKERILVAINQADAAMKGRGWNSRTHTPEPELLDFLEKKAKSVQCRIKEATGVDVEPIYYSAGYKEEGLSQEPPYNISKLLYYIVSKAPAEKRVAVSTIINKKSWNTTSQTPNEKNYKKETTESVKEGLLSSILSGASLGAAVGSKIGGPIGVAVGATIGGVVGAAKKACYITTAICEAYGKSDDCYELTMFRTFRDEWLAKQTDGIELIAEYYTTAPDIVRNIELNENKSVIYESIQKQYLIPCLRHLENKDYKACKENYIKMVRELQSYMK